MSAVAERRSDFELMQAADPTAVPCKVCGGASPLFGVVDANKNCNEAQGKRLPLSGRAVYYRRCEQCGFTFTCAFDDWDHAAFEKHIYNDSYLEVDPDFVERRPAANASAVENAFGGVKQAVRLLDFGGGSGLLASLLRERGFDATTYDPFSMFTELPQGKFEVITCFEVMEHVPSPRETVAVMAKFLKQGGAILFSTLVQPAEFEKVGLNWWYAAPRNGHLSLHSAESLKRVFEPFGLAVDSFNEGFHLAHGRLA